MFNILIRPQKHTQDKKATKQNKINKNQEIKPVGVQEMDPKKGTQMQRHPQLLHMTVIQNQEIDASVYQPAKATIQLSKFICFVILP